MGKCSFLLATHFCRTFFGNRNCDLAPLQRTRAICFTAAVGDGSFLCTTMIDRCGRLCPPFCNALVEVNLARSDTDQKSAGGRWSSSYECRQEVLRNACGEDARILVAFMRCFSDLLRIGRRPGLGDSPGRIHFCNFTRCHFCKSLCTPRPNGGRGKGKGGKSLTGCWSNL